MFTKFLVHSCFPSDLRIPSLLAKKRGKNLVLRCPTMCTETDRTCRF